MIGTKLGKYEIIEKIGEGGFAVVYRAKHILLGHAVAVKQLLPHWSIDKEFSARFRREAEVMARLSPHPHIVQILDIDTIDDEPFFVMEYLPDNLEQRLSERKTLEIDQALSITLQVCRALERAHGAPDPIYHRDIHPGNIFLLGDTVKVGDFGLAKLTETGGSISATGMTAGRRGFVAPEQWEDFKHVDHRADLFSVGAVLYRMLVGKSPGGRRSWIEPIAANPDVSPRLNQFILKAIEEEPDDRFQSAEQMISELNACTRQASPIKAKPVDVAQEQEQAAGEPTVSRPARSIIETELAQKPEQRFQTVAEMQEALELKPAAAVPPTKKAAPPPEIVEEKVPFKTAEDVQQEPAGEPTVRVKARPKVPELANRIRRDKDGAEMVLIPAGEFLMGSDDGRENEKPVHRVYLDLLYIDVYPVTNEQFAQFLNKKGNQQEEGTTWYDTHNEFSLIEKTKSLFRPKKGFEKYPVNCVNWCGARAYAEWVGGRLPTEAEWEKAARGGLQGKKYPWGDESPEGRASFGGEWDVVSMKKTMRPVGSFEPNGYGLYDMAGNVWEWCADWYDQDYYKKSQLENPKGPNSGTARVLRGGAWCRGELICRSSRRGWLDPGDWLDVRGFRVAQDSPQ